MRNDARPIGEAFRDIAEHDRSENAERPSEIAPPAERARGKNMPVVTNCDPGDEEVPFDGSDR